VLEKEAREGQSRVNEFDCVPIRSVRRNFRVFDFGRVDFSITVFSTTRNIPTPYHSCKRVSWLATVGAKFACVVTESRHSLSLKKTQSVWPSSAAGACYAILFVG
jgi:hypothetical protein